MVSIHQRSPGTPSGGRDGENSFFKPTWVDTRDKQAGIIPSKSNHLIETVRKSVLHVMKAETVGVLINLNSSGRLNYCPQ